MKKVILHLQIYIAIFCIVSYIAHDVIIGGTAVGLFMAFPFNK